MLILWDDLQKSAQHLHCWDTERDNLDTWQQSAVSGKYLQQWGDYSTVCGDGDKDEDHFSTDNGPNSQSAKEELLLLYSWYTTLTVWGWIKTAQDIHFIYLSEHILTVMLMPAC